MIGRIDKGEREKEIFLIHARDMWIRLLMIFNTSQLISSV